jgi:hypothetical protein
MRQHLSLKIKQTLETILCIHFKHKQMYEKKHFIKSLFA